MFLIISLLIESQVGEYITTLLAYARDISEEIYLKSTAASFGVAWKMVDRIMEVANQRKDSNISKTLAEDVVWVSFRVFFLLQSIYNLFTLLCGFLPSVIECLKRIWMNIWMKKLSGSSMLLTSSAKVGTRR